MAAMNATPPSLPETLTQPDPDGLILKNEDSASAHVVASLSRKVAELKLKHGGWAMNLSALTLGFADTALAMAGLPGELAAKDRLNAELKFEMALIEDLLTDALEDLAEHPNAGADAKCQETDAVCPEIGATYRRHGGTYRWVGATYRWVGGTYRWVGATYRWVGGTYRWVGATYRRVGATYRRVGAAHPETGRVYLETSKGRPSRGATVRPESSTLYPATCLAWPQGRF